MAAQACGWRLLAREKPGWFPTEELREDGGGGEHSITALERALLGWREGGVEGVCCPTSTYSGENTFLNLILVQ